MSDLRKVTWLTIALLGYSPVAGADVIFDIFNEADVNVGFIQFTMDGVLEDPSLIAAFDYTQNDGDHFIASDVTQLRVLVDAVNGTLCWGDWTVAGPTVPDVADGCGLAPPSDVPRGLTAMNDMGAFNAFDNFVFELGIPNRASAAGDDDEDLRFVIRAVPEPGTFALLGLGLVGIAARRRRKV